MSESKSLTVESTVMYIYDGSFSGFLCCVYESMKSGVFPFEIAPARSAPCSVFPALEIVTESGKAERVLASIPQKISAAALELVKTVFLSCLEQKELLLLKFLLRGYREGGRLLGKMGDPDVAPLLKAERHLMREAMLLQGFVRFSDYGGGLAGVITPKNFILPFIAGHFTLRYKNEDFLIFDKTHKAALLKQGRRAEIICLEDVEFPPVSEEEAKYRSLWKQFYKTVAVEGRENPRCRMSHMPKRYWENMLEVQDLL